MSISSAVVVFAVTWFMVFFVVLPLRLTTQGEDGNVVPGTHSSAPANPRIKQKAKITTLITIVLWALICGIIISGAITVRDFDVMGRMPPLESADK